MAICLLAAMADGSRSPDEEAQFHRIVARLGASEESGLLIRARQRGLTVAEAAAQLSSEEGKRTAFEMAISVVYADGEANVGERAFLAELTHALALEEHGAGTIQRDVESLALAPLVRPRPDTALELGPAEPPRPSQAGLPAMTHDAALDELIRKQALLAGALELLPQTLASLAIIPLQMRLVYAIGTDFGHTLDAAQIKDLLAAMGIGVAGQVLDGMARRLLGGLGRGVFGHMLGGIVGGTAGVAAGAGVSFATTYALGHAAKQYYSQGRRISRQDLGGLFQRFRREAQDLLPRIQEEFHQQAQHLDLARIVASARGG